jgi:hypothetical protein
LNGKAIESIHEKTAPLLQQRRQELYAVKRLIGGSINLESSGGSKVPGCDCPAVKERQSCRFSKQRQVLRVAGAERGRIGLLIVSV